MQNYGDLGDEQLVTLVAHGEKEALEVLYDRYGPRIYSMARYVLRDTHQAEEVSQEIFINVWLKARSFDPRRGNPRTWLMSVAHHRIVDEVRSRMRLSMSTDQVPHELLDMKPSNTPSPEEEAHRSLAREDIIASLASIPEEQRQVIVMAYYEGFSQSEIAERLDQPLGTVKTRTRLGMQKLRQALNYLHGE